MSERLPLPVEVLRAHRPLPAEVDSQTHTTVHRLLDLADRGDYVAAAEEAADLLQGTANDVRLMAIYLMGSFVDRGASSLPDLLEHVDVLTGPGRSTNPRLARRVDSAVEWLLRAVTDRLAFHTKQRDETWRSWLETVTPSHIDAITGRCEQLSDRSSGIAALLSKIARWARDRLGPAAARTRKPPQTLPEPAVMERSGDDPSAEDMGWDEADDDDQAPVLPAAPPELDDVDHDDVDHDDVDHDDVDHDDPDDEPSFGFGDYAPEPRTNTAPHHEPSDLDSPALTQLRQKIQGFERLLARGELDKAAVIARDIQIAIEDFDPLVYLPRLFARHLKLLSQTLAQIEPHWSAEETTSRRVLEQLYRADLEGYIDD